MSTEVIPSTRVQLWGARLTGAGSLMSRYALVVILAWFGGGKYAPAATSWLPRRLPHDVGPAAPISSTWPPPVVAPAETAAVRIVRCRSARRSCSTLSSSASRLLPTFGVALCAGRNVTHNAS